MENIAAQERMVDVVETVIVSFAINHCEVDRHYRPTKVKLGKKQRSCLLSCC